MACCGKHKKKCPKIYGKKNPVLIQLLKETNFNEKEIIDLRLRFEQLSQCAHSFNIFQFRQSMGILGLESCFFLSDRIFNVINDNSDGKVRKLIPFEFPLNLTIFIKNRSLW